MTFMKNGLIAIITSLGVAAACTYSQPQPETGGSTEVTPPPPPKEEGEAEAAPPPADEAAPAPPTGACDDRACSVDQDCCKGYGCAFDPERSKVQRYCLAAQ
jgi:hypothetical protein